MLEVLKKKPDKGRNHNDDQRPGKDGDERRGRGEKGGYVNPKYLDEPNPTDMYRRK